jgi:hypothetical protein
MLELLILMAYLVGCFAFIEALFDKEFDGSR